MGIQLFNAGVKALIEDDRGRILIGRKNPAEEHPIAGEWHLIGGFIDAGEQVAECIEREVMEETGYAVRVGKAFHMAVFKRPKNQPAHFDKEPILFVFCLCRLAGGSPLPADDVSELRWVSPRNAMRLMPREIEKNAVRKYLRVMR
ncbi:NUDIX domain-containing protein [Candidatus Micrarchaeota archaeon]|nr:NUDIX domain-containing protein [Candidatus Micrarchaeota archaeon]